MAFDLEEQEKIDRLKAWWEQWGNLLSGLILAVMLAILGWYGWNWYQANQTRTALTYFEIVEGSYGAADEASLLRLQEANQILQDKHSGNVYTGRAALLAARTYLDIGDYGQAEFELQRVLESSKRYPELVGAATLQLATIYIDQEKFELALSLLNQEMAGYDALFADKRGDVYFAQGDLANASAQWAKASDASGVSGEFMQTMQFKLSILGGADE